MISRLAVIVPVLLLAAPAWGQAFSAYVVGVGPGAAADPATRANGSGVYLGDGRVLTAAHVLGRGPAGRPVTVLVAGVRLPAVIRREGDLDGIDASLISLDPAALPPERRALPPLALCPRLPPVGTLVAVATPTRRFSPRLLPATLLPEPLASRMPTLVEEVDANSGSPVFDPVAFCLLGLITRRIEGTMSAPGAAGERRGLARAFVAADRLAEILR
ncbi:trypsin-like peptidase domain-containing protein [Phaeospirillum tilakii]|uniref:Trypsin-like peptidase domain-containing protein n=1 Tax=Phaeospirillum tilakii TaxID=741673 RepID=A0ABW5CAF7_9PROT